MSTAGRKDLAESVPLNRKYGTTRAELAEIVNKLQQRQFAEELDYLESRGGDKFIIDSLNVQVKAGLKASEFQERVQVFGSNAKKVKPLPGFWELFYEALEDTTLRILLVAGIVSIAIEVPTADEDHRKTSWIEGFAIFMSVLICATVTAGNNYKQERQFRVLSEAAASNKKINVLRDGQVIQLLADDLVVGDVVKIYEGMDIPADGYILEAHEITTDESAMTGETDPIKKATFHACVEKRNHVRAEGNTNTAGHHACPSPIIFSGTKILQGEGLFVVIVVGELSCVGRIEEKLHQEAEATPLQQKLETIAGDIGKLGLRCSILTLAILLIRFLIERATHDWDWKSAYLAELLKFFIIAITVLVVAIPEGLPLAVTLSLSYSVKKMLTDNNLVRRIEACETMGGANVICSDKTGTLTQNKMSLTTIWNDELIQLDTYAQSIDLSKYCPAGSQELLIQAMTCNASATLQPLTGSKTEIALLEFLARAGINYQTYRDKHLIGEYIKFPFTSMRKRMGTILENVENGFPSKKRLHEKGASELVLECCTHFYSWKLNKKIPITPELKQKMEEGIEHMANQALRTICIAYREIAGNEDLTSKDPKNVYDIEKKDLICIGLLGIKDILRQEVPGAIAKCRTAGIRVKMVTGDNKLTARAIAKECGIIEPGDPNAIVLEGIEFIERVGGVVCKVCKTRDCDCPRDKEAAATAKKAVRVDTIANGEEFDKIYRDLCVLARSRPEDKYALVTGLRERGLVVAVTGDGTNDAPALKKADVGFAMGIAGTEVAREASSIILMDDNFNSIVKAVMWGRNIYDSIRKFIQFQLTVNCVAVSCTLIGAAVILQACLTATQMLWVNLIMDTFAALALATEPPTEELLLRRPHNKDDYIVSRRMMKHVFGQAVYQIFVTLLIVFYGENMFPETDEDGESILHNTSRKGLIISGRLKKPNGDDDYNEHKGKAGPSRHFTIVFNTFVFLQIFNFVNARKLQDELNVLTGLKRAPLFIYIVILILLLQTLIVEFGYFAFQCHRKGMTAYQYLISLGFGLFGLIWSVFLKFLSEEKMCPQAGKEQTDPLSSKPGALGVKRSRNEKSLSRKFTIAHDVGKPASLTRVHQMS
eukprot:TRINITY_DN2602_c0_g4_i1.p1 TRINITY_DN2602_c0_g4~~TRINITY_DN2602_c0_g4_i1.p1  ORF type:complete len:1110 (-),score=290.43 TRINITY_DN2602_c0_g4_i1:194-3523(-)